MGCILNINTIAFEWSVNSLQDLKPWFDYRVGKKRDSGEDNFKEVC